MRRIGDNAALFSARMQFLTFPHLTDPVFAMLLVDGVLVSTKGFLVPLGALREKYQGEALPCSFAGVPTGPMQRSHSPIILRIHICASIQMPSDGVDVTISGSIK